MAGPGLGVNTEKPAPGLIQERASFAGHAYEARCLLFATENC